MSNNLPYYLFTGQSTSRENEFVFNRAANLQQQFVDRLRAEREAIEKERRRAKMCCKIQAFWRSYATRKRFKRDLRDLFDKVESDSSLANSKVIDEQIGRLYYFMNSNESSDLQRLSKLASHILSSGYLENNSNQSAYAISNLLVCCVKYILAIASDLTQPLFVLRCFELYFKSNNNIIPFGCKRLLNAGYFKMLAQIEKHRLPLDLSEEVIGKPPVYLAESILDLYKGPLNFALLEGDPNLKRLIFRCLIDDFVENWSPLRRFYFLPQLSLAYNFDDFSSIFDDYYSTNDNTKLSYHHPTDASYCAPFAYIWLFLSTRCPIGTEKATTATPLILSLVLKEYVEHLKSKLPVDVEGGDDDMPVAIVGDLNDAFNLKDDILQFCNAETTCNRLLNSIMNCNKDSNFANDPKYVEIFVAIYDSIHFLQQHCSNVSSNRFMIELPFANEFLRKLWLFICNYQVPSTFGDRTFLDMLHRGSSVNENERRRCLPLLFVFCKVFYIRLHATDDNEIKGNAFDSTTKCDSLISPNTSDTTFPFDAKELVQICASLRDAATGLVELALPDAKANVPDRYKHVLLEMGADLTPNCPREWNRLFESVVQLLQLLQQIDERLHVCPAKHWAVKNCTALANRQFFRYSNRRRGPNAQLFYAARYLSRQEFEQEGNKQVLSSSDLRALTILRKLPFLIPFEDRVVFLYQLAMSEKLTLGRQVWSEGVKISVSRDKIYEDSFTALSPESVPNLKQVLRVSMKNWAGANEAGVDGGGIFREFISELLKAGFSPNRGLFMSSNHDNQLYPNPLSRLIYPDTFHRHYYFLGRVLGKLIFENQLAELPLAKFFLSRLLNRNSPDVEIRHLESLDPIFYKNLISLKSSALDASVLNLNFTVTINEFGEIKTLQLKPNGDNIPVTNENKLEYIQLVTNYYLDEQIREQVDSFCQGLSSMIDLDWLRMFSPNELQMIISGDERSLDVSDLRNHTIVRLDDQDMNDDGRQVVEIFWEVVRSFDNNLKRKLLKFVTGCSRPPLLGFKDLNPPFAISVVKGETNRLPTAATCMNLLKLPKFKDETTLREKLIYAIESASGFELS